MREDTYVIEAAKDGEMGYISIDHSSGDYPCLMQELRNAEFVSYETATDYCNELTSGCFKDLGFKDCRICRVTLEYDY